MWKWNDFFPKILPLEIFSTAIKDEKSYGKQRGIRSFSFQCVFEWKWNNNFSTYPEKSWNIIINHIMCAWNPFLTHPPPFYVPYYKSHSMRALLPLFSSSIFHKATWETIENVIKIFSIVHMQFSKIKPCDHPRKYIATNCSSITNFAPNRHHHLDASIDFQSINQKILFFFVFSWNSLLQQKSHKRWVH